MRSERAFSGFQAFHCHQPGWQTRRGCPAIAIFALAMWASVLLCGPQQACWTAEPPTAIDTKQPEKKPEDSPPAHDSSQQPAAPMSPEEIYAHASPAVVTLKIYSDSFLNMEAGFAQIFSGSGFILADQFAKPVQVDSEAKFFAAPHSTRSTHGDHLGKFLRRREAALASKGLSANSNEAIVEEGEEFQKAREQAFDQDWPNLRQVFIVTNYHVIDSAINIEVQMHDGSTGFVSQIMQEDKSADVAILVAWLPCAKQPAAISLATVPPNVGAKVFVIGSPMELENSLSEGLISGIRELVPGRSVLQTSAAISPGSSGGPILATNGQVVGIATANHPGGQNLNFAVPSSEILRLLEKPPKPREVWRGRSVHKEASYALDRATAALNSKKGGAVLAKALNDSQMAVLYLGIGGCNDILLKHFNTIEEAKQAPIKAIQSVPPEFQYLAYYYLGEFQSNQGRTARAREETKAEAAQRAQLDPHYLAALAAYRKAAEMKPDFAPAYSGLHSVHLSMDEWPEVRLDVDRLMELVPHCAEVYMDRATYFSHYGQHEAALKDLKIAANMNPANQGVQWSMAQEYIDLAKYDEAIEAYQRHIQLIPERQRYLSRYNIGIAYKFSGKYEEAIKAFRRCKASDNCPDHITASCNQQINVCKAVLEELGRPSPE